MKDSRSPARSRSSPRGCSSSDLQAELGDPPAAHAMVRELMGRGPTFGHRSFVSSSYGRDDGSSGEDIGRSRLWSERPISRRAPAS